MLNNHPSPPSDFQLSILLFTFFNLLVLVEHTIWKLRKKRYMREIFCKILHAWKYLYLPAHLNNSLDGSENLCCKLFSLRIVKALLHCLLVSHVAMEKSDATWFLILCMKPHFPLPRPRVLIRSSLYLQSSEILSWCSLVWFCFCPLRWVQQALAMWKCISFSSKKA